jgi:hypothetical protein
MAGGERHGLHQRLLDVPRRADARHHLESQLRTQHHLARGFFCAHTLFDGLPSNLVGIGAKSFGHPGDLVDALRIPARQEPQDAQPPDNLTCHPRSKGAYLAQLVLSGIR